MLQTFKQVRAYFNERDKIGIKPGLNRMLYLLKEVGHPESKVNGIHFAGTNGKGSTIEMMRNALIANDYNVGVFTSPSFEGIRGHISLNGKSINESEFVQLVNELMPHIDALDEESEHPTSFEIITVLAFMYFKDNTDIVLIETGMGGRYDTTNCFIPLLSVITTIAYDHMDFLGSSMEEIASQKAGIIKANRPIVLGNIGTKALGVIVKEADELDAPIYAFQNEFFLSESTLKIEGLEESINMNDLVVKGQHQKENAALAIMSLYVLQSLNFTIKWETVKRAINTTSLPGRFEVVQKNPTIILDSAHNIAGMEALKETILNMNITGEKELLFAGFYDKQLSEMLTVISPVVNKVTLTTFEHERAATYTMLKSLNHDDYVSNWQVYLDNIKEQEAHKTYIITGSLHFITFVRRYLLNNENNI